MPSRPCLLLSCRRRSLRGTNIEIEDDYVKAITDRHGVRTKTEAVDLALRHLAGRDARGARHWRDPGGCQPRRGVIILADTSAWVEYDRATNSRVDIRLTELIDSGGPLAVTEPVMMEVLAGGRSEDHGADLRRLLLRFRLLRFEVAADFHAAALIYRRCRRAGITPRGLIDCMVASVAMRYGAVLLAHDSDIDRIATVVGLEMDGASLQG